MLREVADFLFTYKIRLHQLKHKDNTVAEQSQKTVTAYLQVCSYCILASRG